MSKNIETATVIRGKNWIVRPITTGALRASATNLPCAQNVRGSVWKETVIQGLVKDIKAGLYVPPVVLAGSEEDGHDLSDGQQRYRAICSAVDSGDLDGTEVVLLAVDTGRTFEESFRVLNIGVPVGAGLVAAMSYRDDVKNAVLSLAAHPLFATAYRWTATQVNSTASADFASAALAICAGWPSPQSSKRACIEWLQANGDTVDADAISSTTVVLDSIYTAIMPHVLAVADKGEKGKWARGVCSAMRKKNAFMSTVASIGTGSIAEDVLDVIDRSDLLIPVKYMGKTPKGKPKEMVAEWAVGGGTSGCNDDYNQRLHVLRAAALTVRDHPRDAETTAAQKAASAENDADKLASLVMGV